MSFCRLLAFGLWCSLPGLWLRASAATILVTTNDTFAKIEMARAGDTVLIAPGNYSYRVFLTQPGTAAAPITIRALDLVHRPVWDFGDGLVEDAPGSHTAGYRGRGGWQFSGAQHYRVSGIVFRHCHNAEGNAGGVRYYNGTKNLYLAHCRFEENDNGLTGGSEDSEAVVAACEFNANGNPHAVAPTHNLYIYGGELTLRSCYVHDSVQGENFHLRCRRAVLEYNCFARARNYEGDLMTDIDFTGAGPFTQSLTLRGNVFVQNPAPVNHAQLCAVANDSGRSHLTFTVRIRHNLFIGANVHSSLLHLVNRDGSRMRAEISGNLIGGVSRMVVSDDRAAAFISGGHNWLPAGVDDVAR